MNKEDLIEELKAVREQLDAQFKISLRSNETLTDLENRLNGIEKRIKALRNAVDAIINLMCEQ